MAFVSAGEQASELILLVFSPCSKKFLCWKIFLLNSVGLFLPLGIWSSKKEFCTMLIVRILSDHSKSLLVPLQSQKHYFRKVQLHQLIMPGCNCNNPLILNYLFTDPKNYSYRSLSIQGWFLSNSFDQFISFMQLKIRINYLPN